MPSYKTNARILTAVAAAICLHAPMGMQAAQLPSGFSESLVANGLLNITAMAFAPDGRLFVCEQGGRLRVIKDGALLSSPFVTLSVDPSGERGLLGIAFDPAFHTNRYLYLYYTATTQPRRNRVSRFIADGDFARPGSEQVILELNNLSASNHNGGAMHFGPDGKLYIAVGENAVASNAQTLNNLLGKILRIEANGTIPADNPFYATATGVNRAIWALGLRNPFTFAFERTTGRMYINDVGQSSWEEINNGIRGANYGWPATEGYTSDARFQSPLHAYGHGTGPATGCAITGGAFYRPTLDNPTTDNFPNEYIGSYFFAEFCSGWIRRYIPASNTVVPFAAAIANPVDLQVGPDGALYYASRGSSAVYRIVHGGAAQPSITEQPSNRTVTAGQPAAFSVTAGGSAPLQYQWYRNGAAIPNATAATFTLNPTTANDSGARFYIIVSNNSGSTTSNTATLTVTANRPPTAVIDAPSTGVLYTAGATLLYSGSATDPEDGTLPASAFTWRIDFHHDTHFHPFLPTRTGVKSGIFTIPNTGEQAANVWYRVHLTVRDAGGLTQSIYRDVLPRKAAITLRSAPAGLQITYNGQPVTSAPIQAVVGMIAQIGAASPQALNGTNYEFVSWSDNGAREHAIRIPAANTTYTANFRPIVSGTVSPYLSDRAWILANNGWGPVERDRSNGDTPAGDGRAIVISGVTSAKGLGVHAPSDIQFNLGGACSTFRADIGVDDEVASLGSVVFQVLADGVKIFDSGTMTGAAPSRPVNLDISGKSQLRLVVTDAGNGPSSDHADWANARVSCGTVTQLSDRAWIMAENGYGPVELNRSNGNLAANDGGPLRIAGVTYSKGLGVHAASHIRYALGRACSVFTARAGVDDEVGNRGSVIFQVWADGTKLFDSGVVTGASAMLPVSVDITGRNELSLRVQDGGDGVSYDHADWADAKITCN